VAADPAKAAKPTIADYSGGLDKQLDGMITANRTTRATLDKEKATGAKSDDTAKQLDGDRQHLLDQLNQRSGVYGDQIAAEQAKLGKVGKTPTADQKTEMAKIAELQKEQGKYSDQQTALQRWHDRGQINSINDQLKNPNLDPKVRSQLLAQKKQLATGLLSTVKHYEQFDPQWGSTTYGKDRSYTSMTAAGCGPTGLADLMDFADQEDPEGKHAAGDHDPYTPRKMADYATYHGRVKGSGTDGTTMMNDLSGSFPSFSGHDVSDSADAATQLHNGIPVLFLGHDITGQGGNGKKIKPYDGHYMVLSGANDDGTNFQVTDGGRNDSRNMHSITSSQLAGHTDGYWTVNHTP
jgi:hypothetical protein